MKTLVENEDKSKNDMDNLNNIIDVINDLQTYCRKYNKSKFDFPEIVVIGAQSTGKSSILERIISCDILPKNKETSTKCPIILQLSRNNQEEIMAEFVSDSNLHFEGEVNIQQKIQEITDGLKGFPTNPITIKLTKKDFPQLTLVDLPGLIKNSSAGNEQDVDALEKLAVHYAQPPNSIILAVSAANVDLANSDSINISRKLDPEGRRTFHVITKVDLMDKGTDARDLLKNELLKKSLGVILLKNRSQKSLLENKTTASVLESEKTFLAKYYPEICDNHGINVLIKELVNIFHSKIKEYLPKIREDLEATTRELESEIKCFDKFDNNRKTLKNLINKFIKKYEEIIKGNMDYFDNKLTGGALISIIIYDEFEREINDLKVDNSELEDLIILMRNTAGNMKASYSIEKAYLNLSKKQILKFFNPTEKTLEDVKYLLKEFVQKAINEANICQYYQLIRFLTDEMQVFIDKHFENTNKIIKSLVKCEKNNVFCEYPIKTQLQLANNSKKYPNETQSKTNEYEFENIPANKKVKKTKGTLENNNNESDNTDLIIQMVKDNFEMVQKNIICNFPKWIQKFMIKDLLKSMKELDSETNEDPSHLLKLDEKLEKDLRILKNEIKECEKLRNELNERIKNL